MIKSKPTLYKKISLLGFFFLQGCTILISDSNYHSITYEGYAFNAMINDVPVIEISNKETISSLKNYRDINSVKWQLLKPINPLRSSNDLSILLKERKIKEHDIGKILTYDIQYHPLTPMKVKTKRVKVEHKSVLINGNPMVSYQEVIKSLPIGDYVFSLRARGSENWDRKEIFVKVRDTNVSSFL